MYSMLFTEMKSFIILCWVGSNEKVLMNKVKLFLYCTVFYFVKFDLVSYSYLTQ